MLSIVVASNNYHHRLMVPYIEENTKGEYELIIVDNGANIEEATIKNDKNNGIPKSYNQAWKIAKGDFIAFIHSDLYIYEKGWDLKVSKYLKGNVGIVGFGGSKAFGASNLYKVPYHPSQLGRGVFFSNLVNAKEHGLRIPFECGNVAVLDGIVLIVNKKLLEVVGGFDEFYTFFMYDNNMCLESLKRGYKNLVVNVLCEHCNKVPGGSGKGMINWVEEYGESMDDTYRKAHEHFYEKWRGFIPIRVN